MKKYNFVYKTTNLINGKIYIGVHSTNNLDDGYLGSGTSFSADKKKYGKENFSREILEFFENATDAYLKEALLVNHIFLLRPDVYNRTHGGKGGYNNISDEGKIRISESRTGTVVAIKNGQIISVSKDIFDSDETLVGHTKGFVTVTDGTKYFQVSVNDERYTAGLLVPPSTNLVVAIDKETGERVVVTKSVFDLNDQLVGNTYGSVQSIESNLKRSQSLKGKKKPISFTEKVKCTYCDTIGIKSNMKRWHFENCKLSPSFDKDEYVRKIEKLFKNNK